MAGNGKTWRNEEGKDLKGFAKAWWKDESSRLRGTKKAATTNKESCHNVPWHNWRKRSWSHSCFSKVT